MNIGRVTTANIRTQCFNGSSNLHDSWSGNGWVRSDNFYSKI